MIFAIPAVIAVTHHNRAARERAAYRHDRARRRHNEDRFYYRENLENVVIPPKRNTYDDDFSWDEVADFIKRRSKEGFEKIKKGLKKTFKRIRTMFTSKKKS